LEDYGYITKEAMISRIVDAHLFVPQDLLSDKSPDNLQLHEDAEAMSKSRGWVKETIWDLCSFGEPWILGT